MSAPGSYPSLSSHFLEAGAAGPRLRVGLLLDSATLPRVFRAVVDDLLRADFVDLVVVVYNADELNRPAATGNPIGRLLTSAETRRQFLYLLYEKLDQRRNRTENDPTEAVDCTDLLGGISRRVVTPLTSRFVHLFPADAIESLRELNLDVLIRFGFNILKGDVLTCARYGIWSYHHGDNDEYRGTPPHLWEVIEGNPVSGVILQRLGEKLDAGVVLQKGLFKTSSAVSVAKNRFGPYWCSQHFMIQKLRELHDQGWDTVLSRAAVEQPYRGKRTLYRTPGNLDMIRWVIGSVVPTAVRRLLRRGRTDQWRIGLRRSAEPLYAAEDPSLKLREFCWTSAPKGRFWADPFLIEKDGVLWVFFEDYSHTTHKGTIWCARVRQDGSLEDAKLVLERPYHLSYPFIFTHGGETYMVPESEAAGTIDLYRARSFPDDWVLETTLLTLRAVDSTLFQHQERWWMITTPMPVEHHAAVSLLYSAPTLTGPWTLHPASPISSDVRAARSAGQVFASDNGLVRTSMDCSRNYGYALQFNSITELSASAFREHSVATALPGALPDQIGVHTYNRLGDWEIVDACFIVSDAHA